MFNLSQVSYAIGNRAYYARGMNYVREGRVEQVGIVRQGDLLIAYGQVCGSGDNRYSVTFEYDRETEEFSYCMCDCPAFEKAEFGCKHVAALMIKVYMQAAEEEEQEREREWERRQAEWHENQQRAWRKSFVSELVGQERQRRRRNASLAKQEAKVRLHLTLAPEPNLVLLELKIGRTRPYVVRNFEEFARRVEQRKTVMYGRELTFSHREEEVEERDIPLLRHIVLLADHVTLVSGGRMELRDAALDQTMRLLLGREVDIRLNSGETVRVPVREEERKLEIGLRRGKRGTLLNVTMEDVARGSAGVYFFGTDAVRCVFGEAGELLGRLVCVGQNFPKGLLLEDEELGSVCGQIIAPAVKYVTLRSGEKILNAHMPMAMTPRFYIDMDDEGRLTCRLRFEYGGVETVPGEAYPHIRRDELLEEQAMETAAALFPLALAADECAREEESEAKLFALLTEELPSLEAFGEVMISKRLAQMNVQTRRSMSFGLAVSGTELLLHADLGGFTQDELREAYASYRQKKRYVRLDGGVFLSGDALEQAAQAAQVLDTLDVTAEEAQEGVELPATRAMYLEAALRERESIRLSAPQALLDWTKRLREAQKTRAQAPKTLKAELREYQLTGLSWLCALNDADFGGILADDMGLGKTLQALALLVREQESGLPVRALVVCPASLQLNWLMEAERFAPSLTCQVLTGTAKRRAEQIAADNPPNILVTSYDQLRRDAQAYADIELTHVLLDEAQYIKNASSQGAKAVKTLRARHRFAMTGTPIENRLGELWSIFDFLMPGYLLSYKKFRERFETPIVREDDEDARKSLQQMAAPFILRRMKREVLSDLPEKVETLMTSELTPEQRRLYAAHAARLLTEAQGGMADAPDRMRILAGLTRLRQLCCDPRLCLENYEGGSGKLVQCVEVVKDALGAGHRILLFSQFTSMLELLREALEAEGISTFTLTGQTDKDERMRLVEAFNAGGAQVFLISLKAGGTGLNLTGADVVIHYDPWWNTSAQNQATDRAHRIGQKRSVQVIRLIASGTVEERILLLQERKRALSDGVLEGGENLFTVDTEMLRELLRG